MVLASEIQARQQSVRSALADRGWGCAVVTSPQNFAYLTGLSFEALMTSAARSLVCIVPSYGPVRLIVPSFVAAEAAESLPDSVVTGYDPPRHSVDESMIHHIDAAPPGPVGLESGPESRIGMTLHSTDRIRQAIGDRGEGDVADILWEIRMRKSPSEIAAIAKASRAGSLAFQEVFGEGVVGRSEREIATSLARAALENGADRAEWVACTSGTGSYHRFVSGSRDRIVEPGDIFWADIGLTCDGYWTDFCRAAVAGRASEERLTLQAAIVEATAAGVEHCRPGTPVGEVAAAIRIAMAGLGSEALDYGRLGHGIGLSSTEPPSIAEWDRTVLNPGMVVTIEPAISNDTGVYCAEQVVVVTENEPQVLTTASSQLTET